MLAFAAFLLAPGVTYEGDAASAATVLAAIGKAAGTTLSADAKLTREILLVRAKNVPLDDLMRRIAAATGGEWKAMDAGGYRLFLSPGTDAAQRRAESRARVDAYRYSLDRWGASDAQLTIEEYRRGVRAGTVRPKAWSVGSLVAELSDDVLASVRPGKRIVLSTAPTGRQAALPPGSLARLQKLTTGPIPSYDSVPGPAPAYGPPVVGWLTLREESGYAGFDANAFLADASGHIVGWNKQVVSRSDLTIERKPPTLAHPETPVALDAKTVEMTQVINLDQETGLAGFDAAGEEFPNGPRAFDLNDLGRAPGEVPERLLHPEREEPLAWGAGASLAQIAKGESASLVALLPDDALVASLDALKGGKTTAGEYLKAMSLRGDLNVEKEPGWLVARPQRPATARDARLDRAILGATMRALAARGGLTLDEQAAEALAQPLVGPTDNFEVAFVGALNPAFGARVGASVGSGERLTLRLFRALGGEAGIRQTTTKARAVGSLPTDARRWLEALVYDSDGGPNFKDGPPEFPNVRLPRALAQERTFRWPNGIPANLTFAVADATEDAYYGLAPSGAHPQIVEGGWSIGIGDEGRSVSSSAPRLAAYAKGQTRTVSFTLREGDKERFARRLQEDRVGPNTVRIAFEELPEPLRKNILSAEEGIRKSIEDQRKARTVAP